MSPPHDRALQLATHIASHASTMSNGGSRLSLCPWCALADRVMRCDAMRCLPPGLHWTTDIHSHRNNTHRRIPGRPIGSSRRVGQPCSVPVPSELTCCSHLIAIPGKCTHSLTSMNTASSNSLQPTKQTSSRKRSISVSELTGTTAESPGSCL
jgi:hypothetical protein